MATEENEGQPRPRKVIPSIRREGTDSRENNYERKPFNRPEREGNSYGNRSNNRGAYGGNHSSYEGNSYGNNRPSYGNRPRTGGYSNENSSYGNRPSRPRINEGRENDYNRSSYNSSPNSYDRPRQPNRYSQSGGGYGGNNSGNYASEDASGVRRKRPRVGESSRVNSYGNRDSRDSRDFRGGEGGGYRPRTSGGYGNRPQGGNRPPFNQKRISRPSAAPQPVVKYKELVTDPTAPIRLNKYLSNAGVCSRREADEFIQAGVVKVNDQVITELGTKITRLDRVMFHDQPVEIESKIYIVLNKPKNCVTTSDDPQERRTVMDLVKNACRERIYPVGRLDRNTTGVLLLTNDGDLASKLTHPSFKKKKIYHVWLDKNVAIEDMEKLANGLELEDGEIHADAISYATEDDKSQVGIEIHSGRNRIVRRMFETLGYHVIKLDRVYFAGLTKKNLPRGKWRYLSEREVNALRMGAFE
ncbi:pseudouridine synthase [Parabacteroides sp. Marseille-P3160]|uniref:pseudouridine synthase n=1 Tax=Parabacteroides sp. Marseille-P3160 TaxID=1917887 RepID=UPI0009BBCEFC|nr:pseudouridine synthase [Parabacteroides sp. Marseille-P3160]